MKLTLLVEDELDQLDWEVELEGGVVGAEMQVEREQAAAWTWAKADDEVMEHATNICTSVVITIGHCLVNTRIPSMAPMASCTRLLVILCNCYNSLLSLEGRQKQMFKKGGKAQDNKNRKFWIHSLTCVESEGFSCYLIRTGKEGK